MKNLHNIQNIYPQDIMDKLNTIASLYNSKDWLFRYFNGVLQYKPYPNEERWQNISWTEPMWQNYIKNWRIDGSRRYPNKIV